MGKLVIASALAETKYDTKKHVIIKLSGDILTLGNYILDSSGKFVELVYNKNANLPTMYYRTRIKDGMCELVFTNFGLDLVKEVVLDLNSNGGQEFHDALFS